MRVLMVLNSLAPGGTEQSTLALAPPLRDLGVEVSIVTLKSAAHELDHVAAAAGVPVQRLQAGGFLHRLREIRHLIRTDPPDVVHTALFDADLLGRLAAWRTGVPVISSFVSTPYDSARLEDPNVTRWKLRVLQVADAVTGRFLVRQFHSVSEGVKTANARALHLPTSCITVAERGRDTATLGERTPQRRAAIRSSLGIAPDAPVLLNLGRQDHHKAQVDLIAATALLVTSHPALVVLVAGKEGNASDAIRSALAARPAAAACVRILGHRTDVGDLLVAADVLVVSSHVEGTAGVALEAMALGTPVVSTDLEGLRGVLTHEENSLLVPPANPAALAGGIARILDDPALATRLAVDAEADFVSRFTLQASAARMASLYQKVVEDAS